MESLQLVCSCMQVGETEIAARLMRNSPLRTII